MRKTLSKVLLTVIALLPAGLLFSAGVSYAEDNNGVPLTVQVVTPTTAPSPRSEVPVSIPVDVPVSEAVFPISLSGLDPYSYVEIFANSTPILIASGFADSAGKFEVSVRLPANLPVGDHTISATNTLKDGTKVSTIAIAFSVTSSGKIGAPAGGGDNLASANARSASAGFNSSNDPQVTEETTTGSASALALGPDPFNLGGVFYIGGLSSHAIYPQGIFSPAAVLHVAIRNVSTERVPASLSYQVKNSYGMVVGQVEGYKLRDFEPGETREITVTVNVIGQWTFYSANLTITPPKNVGQNTLTPIELTSSFIAFAGVVLAWALIAAFLVGLCYMGIRLWSWPTPREVIQWVKTSILGQNETEPVEVTGSPDNSVENEDLERELAGVQR
ncbi:hypothetical protein M2116_000637 [Aurantimicrobium minutum]|uniref:hypothetical protein n=1 Tax=Aurantimicrobium minutum TaxID=708131 RepID=UPI002406A73D|nr:hypothetical protein [Aurantimicrobium minutum]MDF9809693.1 hypothetical protein [Aurantimicrobium minutum]